MAFTYNCLCYIFLVNQVKKYSWVWWLCEYFTVWLGRLGGLMDVQYSRIELWKATKTHWWKYIFYSHFIDSLPTTYTNDWNDWKMIRCTTMKIGGQIQECIWCRELAWDRMGSTGRYFHHLLKKADSNRLLGCCNAFEIRFRNTFLKYSLMRQFPPPGPRLHYAYF